MPVTLVATEGRGGEAEIELDGHRLRVVDAVSRSGRPAAPGVLRDVRLEVVVIPHLTRRLSAADAASRGLEREHGWRYRAIGRIVATGTPCVDVGGLRLALPEVPGIEWRCGDDVSVGIDRIVLRPAVG